MEFHLQLFLFNNQYVKDTHTHTSKVTNLFHPGSARRELPLRDGRLPHADFWGEGEHGGGRSLRLHTEQKEK